MTSRSKIVQSNDVTMYDKDEWHISEHNKIEIDKNKIHEEHSKLEYF